MDGLSHTHTCSDPSAQLCHELQDAVAQSLSSRRPILHHLTADTSWLLQVPRPSQATRRGGRRYFNILIDPWLSGSQSDVSSWLSKQWHSIQPAVCSIAAVEELLQDIETLAASSQQQGLSPRPEEEGSDTKYETLIDAVAISHEFTDHCHKGTLLEIHPDVPVFATENAAALVQSWHHFRLVQTIPAFSQDEDADWHATSVLPLPEWLGISRLITAKDFLNYHSALLIAFNNRATGGSPSSQEEEEEDESAEAVIYSPHGIQSNSDDLALVAKASPPVRTLAILHGLQDISLSMGSASQLNLGAHNGLQVQRLMKARYWIGTHDETKKGSGLVGWLLRRKTISVQDALEAERRRLAKEGASQVTYDASLSSVNWKDLGNGESIMLY